MVSACLLLAGYLLTVLNSWEDAPTVIALPVKVYFAVFVNVRNGLFEGFFYVAVGAVLGIKYESLEKLPIDVPVVMAVVGILGCMFVSNNAHLPFCVCASIGVFLLSIRRCGANLKPHVAARNASTIIYLVHMFFVVAFVYGICGGTEPALFANEVNRPLLFLFAISGSLVVSAVVILVAKKIPAIKRVFGI